MSGDLQAKFSERFGGASRLYRAPGRVNLIGEHTDYNEGYVTPVAIGLSCWVAIGPRDDHKLVIYSEDLDESVELDLASPELRPSQDWSDYPLGVAAILQQEGHSLRGANLHIRTHVRLGARLSSAFAVIVPYWAVWSFETLVLSKRHLASIDQLTASERDLLAGILKQITTHYDNLFEVPFPNSMGFHQSPTDKMSHEKWHFHAHYYSPLLCSATVQKFMVGYEMMATPQRDLTPESAALRLRDASDVLYRDRKS